MVVFSQEVEEVLLEVAAGDIAAQPGFDAVVNAANSHMAPGTGVSGAIHRGAGPELWEECKGMTPLKVGEAAITKAYRLPNRYVIHCFGPRYGVDEKAPELLGQCYHRVLALAEEFGLESMALPAISTGAFAFPWKEAAKVAWASILQDAPALQTVSRIRVVLHDEPTAVKNASVLQSLLRAQKQANEPSG
jgi:O-acetyl-ADP-ribose deacetylase (regulator of RNase III)